MPNPIPTDEELIERARRGERDAFGVLVERYEPKVAATVVGMLGRGADADDVGQETFIRFFGALESFRGESSVGTYLTRIAINQSLKAIRRRRTWSERFLSRDDDRELEHPAVHGGAAIDERERVELVQQALATLPPEHRAVVVLRVMEGYSTKETAEMLGLPQGTVMSRLSRALEKLEPHLVELDPKTDGGIS
jgi:RNA polymerase sigma-70 factor (ECF subfamily)